MKIRNIALSFKSFLKILLVLNPNYLLSQQVKYEVKHPEWSYNQSIYEVNLRQYSAEGTFKAFEKDLPRLKKLGVGII